MEGALRIRPQQDPPPSLRAHSMCEAFQLTAAERPDAVALRTIGDGVAISFSEYAERVRRLATSFHALGVRSGDTVGFMLTNRPEFHLLDTAVMHLGGAPFSIYNTSSLEQIAYLLSDAGNRVMVVEAAFLDQAREATGWRSDEGSVISFLPNAHIADRGLVHYAQMIWGFTITTCPDPAQVFAHAVGAPTARL